jgi:hypothetical protein
MDDPDKSRIDNLKQILYSRKVKINPNFVLDLNGHKNEVNSKWDKVKSDDPKDDSIPAEHSHVSNMSKKVFWAALIFFTISAIIAGYIFIRGSNIISASNIKIDIVGPTSIKAGEETVLDISITNNNDTTLEIADLVLEYPKGTRSNEDQVTDMSHFRIAFGDIKPGETVRNTAKAIFFGEESKVVHIDMTLEYRVPTSMSVFTKDTSYEGIVGSSPLTLSIDGMKEVNANQDYIVTLNVNSNSNEIIKNIVVTGDLPFGFEPYSYNPSPLPKTSVWDLGDIEPNGKREIVIKGKMFGDKNEERYFKFNVGTKDDKDQTQISGVVASVTQSVVIREPFIGVNIGFAKTDSSNGDFVARSGSSINGFIDFRNNLNVPIYDAVIEAKIGGELVSLKDLKATEGFFDSNSGVVRWNKFYDKKLESILPKNKESVSFKFETFRSSSVIANKLNNTEIIIDVTVRGKRRLESGVPEEIVSTMYKKVRIESDTNLSSQITHTTGPIENEGELPPKVGKKTEYTVTWAVTNTFNNLSEGKVKTVLPDYVSWTGISAGAGEKLTYNESSREVIWDLGPISQQVDGKPNLRQVSFQISFTPSQSQVGMVPDLTDVANFTARDTFTNTNISKSSASLTTAMPTDPVYKYDDSQVAQ